MAPYANTMAFKPQNCLRARKRDLLQKFFGFHKNDHLSTDVAHKTGHPACGVGAADADSRKFVHPSFVAAVEDEDVEDAATWAGDDEVAFHRGVPTAATYT